MSSPRICWNLGGVNEKAEMEYSTRISGQVVKWREKIISHQSLAWESKFPSVHNWGGLGRKGVGEETLVDMPVVTLQLVNSCSWLNGSTRYFMKLMATWKALVPRTFLKEKRETT